MKPDVSLTLSRMSGDVIKEEKPSKNNARRGVRDIVTNYSPLEKCELESSKNPLVLRFSV